MCPGPRKLSRSPGARGRASPPCGGHSIWSAAGGAIGAHRLHRQARRSGQNRECDKYPATSPVHGGGRPRRRHGGTCSRRSGLRGRVLLRNAPARANDVDAAGGGPSTESPGPGRRAFAAGFAQQRRFVGNGDLARTPRQAGGCAQGEGPGEGSPRCRDQPGPPLRRARVQRAAAGGVGGHRPSDHIYAKSGDPDSDAQARTQRKRGEALVALGRGSEAGASFEIALRIWRTDSARSWPLARHRQCPTETQCGGRRCDPGPGGCFALVRPTRRTSTVVSTWPETRFALARALWDSGRDRKRSMNLAHQARKSFRAHRFPRLSVAVVARGSPSTSRTSC